MAWTGYRPADFLLFDSTTYWRLFELSNEELMPLTAVLPALAALAALAILRGSGAARRAGWAALALGWAWSGLVFVGERYAAINWAAEPLAPLFALQALGLLLAGAAVGRLDPCGAAGPRARLGAGLAAFAVTAHPLLATLDGRPLAQAEIAGIAPDPTAILTLGLLAAARPGPWPALLAVLPGLWCAASAATLLTMGAWQGWIVAAAALAGLLGRLLPARPAAP
jgi:hypothetical protein